MYITHVKLRNWRNFPDADLNLSQLTSYIIGPNASGKSNLLDVFRFLRDICKPTGGGLQKAVEDRGGITKLRCLHARRAPEVCIEVHFSDRMDNPVPYWKYVLAIKSAGKGSQRSIVSKEEVWSNNKAVLKRPDRTDNDDAQLLTETHLEQTRANSEFRVIANFFANVTYLHLVPQLLKFGDKIGGNRLEDDPFGQGFLERIAKCPKNVRDARLNKIGEALKAAVPQFIELRYQRDEMGHPHLEARYEHHRPNAGWQREEQFSDGTLRLLGILWSLLDGNGMLLIEEPELSLHLAVVEQIPLLINRIQRKTKNRRQVIISTHSEAMLDIQGISPQGVIIIEPSREGSHVRPVNDSEAKGIEAGLTIADAVLPQTRPHAVKQLGFWE